MRKILFFTVFLVFFAAFEGALASNFVRKMAVSGALDGDERYFALLEADYRNDKHRLFQRHYDGGLGVKIDESWFLALKYRQTYRKDGGEWDLHEKRTQAQAIHKIDWKNIVFKLRFRQEYRDYEADQSWRSRFRVRLVSKKVFWGFKPVASNEFYYDVKESRYSKNRFEGGLYFPEIGVARPALMYRRDSFVDADRRWKNNDIAFIRLDIKI